MRLSPSSRLSVWAVLASLAGHVLTATGVLIMPPMGTLAPASRPGRVEDPFVYADVRTFEDEPRVQDTLPEPAPPVPAPAVVTVPQPIEKNPTPPVPPAPLEIALGKDDGKKDIKNWIGSDQPGEHAAPLASTEQPFLRTAVPAGAPVPPMPALAPAPSVPAERSTPAVERATEPATPAAAPSETTPPEIKNSTVEPPKDKATDAPEKRVEERVKDQPEPKEQPKIEPKNDAKPADMTAKAKPTGAEGTAEKPPVEAIPAATPPLEVKPTLAEPAAPATAKPEGNTEVAKPPTVAAAPLAEPAAKGAEGPKPLTIDDADAKAIEEMIARVNGAAQLPPAPPSPATPVAPTPPAANAPTGTPATPPKEAAAPAPAAKPGKGGEAREMDEAAWLADKESDPTSTRRTAKFQAGRVDAGEGLEIITVNPRFGPTVRNLTSPRSPVFEVKFDRAGAVKRVRMLRSSGIEDVNEPVKNALYQWRAKGRVLNELPAQYDGVTLRITIILGT